VIRFGSLIALAVSIAVTAGAPSAALPDTLPFPHISYVKGDVGYAQVGAALEIIADLTDAHGAVARPESQAFIDASFRQFEARLSKSAAKDFSQARASLTPTAAEAHDLSLGAYQHAMEQAIVTLPLHERRCFALGAAVQQAGHNAVLLRDERSDAQIRGAIAQLDELDGLLPRFHDLRTELVAQQPGDWGPISSIAFSMTGIIFDGKTQ
jgi:hypothetical protein